MTRTLTGDITTQTAAASSTPIYYARLDIGGSVGTKWVADRDIGAADGSAWNAAIGCVTAWGTITAQLQEDPRFTPIGDTVITLNDHDKTWHNWYKSAEFQNARARIYLSFSGLAESDLTLIFDGIINDTPQWSDDRRSFTLNLTDAATKRNKTIGTLADVETFPGLSEEATDIDIVPIVFGNARRVPCVPANVAPSCKLVKICDHADTKIYVDDASKFPQNTAIKIQIEQEIAEGSFSGNTFTATTRNMNIRTTSVVDCAVDEKSFDDLDLSPNSGSYVGNYIYIENAGFFGGKAWRYISAYDGTLRRLFYKVPFIKDGAYWTVPAGTTYDITTRNYNSVVATHPVGAIVRLVQEELAYIAADHPCAAVSAVEAYGTTRDYHGDSDNIDSTDTPTFIKLDPDWYTVNTNDTTSFPSLGHAITTITMTKMPKAFIPSLDSNRLWADVDGAETNGDGTGTVIENPADIIKELLTRSVWGDIEGAGYDSASFTAAQSRLSYLHMAFAITSQWELLDVVADLAYQSRSALNWNDGVAFLKVLNNESRGSVATLDNNSFSVGTIQRAYTSLREIANEINAVYEDRLDKQRVKVVDTGEQTTMGRKVSERYFWAYRAKNEVMNIASFWLNRHKMIYEIVRLKGWLNLLAVERVDTVALDYTSLFDSGQFGTIMSVRHSPGGGEGATAPSIELEIRLPRHAGCSSICEANCETGGCESGCEFACEEQTESCWQCETSCETLCELTGCTTTTEIWCATSDAGCGESGPCGACETSCTTACELDGCETGETGCPACETANQTGCGVCETSCEVSCTVGCEVTCETGCETGCEGTCQTGCEVACEGTCQTGCEIACEEGCQTSCEGTCQTGCEVACEGTCQTGCEVACEGTCQAGCEITCETGCETSCETGCEVECEITCETGCEISCETGCEVECETSDETCEFTCETGCEWGCEQECETGAESCATSCQVGCESNCETGCQGPCETACETGCQVTCQAGCETACESGCETSCETGCETGGECAFSDNFNRSDADPLDGDWGATVHLIGSTNDWELLTNRAYYQGGSALQVGLVWHNGTACGNDHEVKGYLNDSGTDGGGASIMGRGDGDDSCYGGSQLDSSSTSYTLRITKYINGSYSVIARKTGSSPGVYRLRLEGDEQKLYVGASLQLTGGDTSLATGNRGAICGSVGGFGGNSFSCMDNFEMGELDAL